MSSSGACDTLEFDCREWEWPDEAPDEPWLRRKEADEEAMMKVFAFVFVFVGVCDNNNNNTSNQS